MSDPASSHLYCPRCGYDLTGLAQERCPECGVAFDLQQLQAAAAAAPALTFGGAVARLLWLPVIATALGVLAPVCAEKLRIPAAVGFPMTLLIGIGFIALGVRMSARLAQQLAVVRATTRGISMHDSSSRSFLVGVGIGLFCCQAALSAAGFFGGCVCGVLASL